MNKGELVAEVARRTNIVDSQVARIVDTLLETVKARVEKGDRVTLSGFGTFVRRERNPRVGRNPRTGEAVKIGRRTVPVFNAGAAFKEAVAAKRAPRKRAAKKVSAKKAPTRRR